MGKAEQKQQQQQLNQDISQTQQKSGQISGQLNDVLSGARSTASSMLPSITGGYTDISGTGGLDASSVNNLRNMYSTYAKEGGISEDAATAMRNRAFRSAEGAYQTAAGQAQRAGSTTGNYGYSGAIAGNLARQGSEAAARAVTDSNADIAKLRQTGQLQGAAGLTGLESQIAQNKLQALGGQAQLYGLNLNEANQTVDNILKEYQTTGQLTEENRNLLIGLANRPGVFDKIVGTIGTLGGAAAGIMTGVGALSKPSVAGGGRSDARVKKDIKLLGWIKGIPIVIFKFLDEVGNKIGTIAQEVEKKWPDLVYEIDKIKYVNYSGLSERLKN